MPLDFPASPSVGQIFADWKWDGAKWVSVGAGGTASVTVSDAPPSSPVSGALWWSSLEGQMYLYYTDPNTSQWIVCNNVGASLINVALSGNPTAPTPPVGDADTSVATTAFVQSAVAPTQNNIGRNLIHNSMFNVQQRGVGGWSVSGSYTADRWFLSTATDTGVGIFLSATTDTIRAAIGDEAATYYFGGNVTGSATAGAYTQINQSIEGVRRLAGKTVTVSFWGMPAAISGLKMAVSLTQVFGTGGSPSANVDLAGVAFSLTASTWIRYSATFNIPSMSGKTLGTNSNDRTQLQFWFSSSSTYATRSANIGAQTGTFIIWGVQLEIGSVATPLEKIEFGEDLRRCQRFYQQVYIYVAGLYTNAAGAGVGHGYSLPVQLRASPTVTIVANYSTNVGTITPNYQLSTNFLYVTAISSAAGGVELNASLTCSADL